MFPLPHNPTGIVIAKRFARPGAILFGFFALTFLAAAAALQPDEVIIPDAGSAANTSRIWQVSGAGVNTAVASGGTDFDAPRMVIAPGPSRVYFYNYKVNADGGSFVDAVYSVDPGSGTVALVSGAARGSGDANTTLTNATDATMAWNPATGKILVGRGYGTQTSIPISPYPAGVLQIDPVSGDRSYLTGDGVGTGGTLTAVVGVAVSPLGQVYILDQDHSSDPTNILLYAVASNGDRTAIGSNLLGSGKLAGANFMTYDNANDALIVSDANGIFRLSPGDGSLTQIVATGSLPDSAAPVAAMADAAGTSIYYYNRGGVKGIYKFSGGAASLFLTGTGNFTQDGNNVQSMTLVRSGIPIVTSSGTASGDTSSAFTYTITATEQPASFSVTGTLPAGIALDSSSGVISGTTSQAGTFNVTVGAINDDGTGTKSLAITIADTTPPVINSISAPASGVYHPGDNLDFTVNFSESVTVTGSPRLPIVIGATAQNATYQSGSPGTAIVFRHTVQTGDFDSDGVALASPLTLNGGDIKDAAGNNAVLTFSFTNPSAAKVSSPATHFTVSLPGSATAGTAVTATVTALDVNNNTVFDHTGTAHFTSNDGVAEVPADYTFVAGDNG
ncbi:MAG TPA: Ig domain-containing protein, partial [Verrucomicrobiae bacterium]|nr:Ig domain-containing protein [Verrucomicrobiae bacterium]